jgi:hypothetical protein
MLNREMISRTKKFIGIIGVACAHVFIYITLWGVGFTMGDAHRDIPGVLIFVLGALGTPLMFLLRLDPAFFAPHGRWWGDDSNFIIGLAVMNGLLWASLIMAGLVRSQKIKS